MLARNDEERLAFAALDAELRATPSALGAHRLLREAQCKEWMESATVPNVEEEQTGLGSTLAQLAAAPQPRERVKKKAHYKSILTDSQFNEALRQGYVDCPRRSWNSTQFASDCWSVPFDVFGLECGC